jgi:hypothetical protein
MKRAAIAAATAVATTQSSDASIRSTSVAFSNEGSNTIATAGAITATSASEESIIAELIRCAVVPSLTEQVSVLFTASYHTT